MNSIAPFLSSTNILLDLEVDNKERVFEAVGDLLDGRYNLSKTQVTESLIAREKLGSTGVGSGMAIPHARTKGLNQVIILYVRTKSPIPFDAPDNQPVAEMMVIFVPERAAVRHLKILAAVAEMFQDKLFREQLKQCENPVAAYDLLAYWPKSRVA
ncbi:MAG: PTS sugar transporter subunit IIA [Pseudomonadota bacterium]